MEARRDEAHILTPIRDRFFSKVVRDPDTECWEWMASKQSNGYGRFGVGGRDGRGLRAHRVAYELLVGPIPAGLEIDHLCRNRGCVNPAHMEPVTHHENMLRGDTLPAKEAAQTHCKRGHLFDEANTYRRRGSRECRACIASRARASRMATR